MCLGLNTKHDWAKALITWVNISLTPLSNSKWKIDGTLSLDKLEKIPELHMKLIR